MNEKAIRSLLQEYGCSNIEQCVREYRANGVTKFYSHSYLPMVLRDGRLGYDMRPVTPSRFHHSCEGCR